MRISGMVAGIVGLVAFAMNPGFGCSSPDDEFTYGEEDMRALVLGEWIGTLETDQRTQSFSLTLDQAQAASTSQGLVAGERRLQCASREFIKPAGACVSQSTMPLVGTVQSELGTYEGPVTGYFIAGLTLDSVQMRVILNDRPFLDSWATAEGIVQGQLTYYDADNREKKGTFTMSRP